MRQIGAALRVRDLKGMRDEGAGKRDDGDDFFDFFFFLYSRDDEPWEDGCLKGEFWGEGWEMGEGGGVGAEKKYGWKKREFQCGGVYLQQ